MKAGQHHAKRQVAGRREYDFFAVVRAARRSVRRFGVRHIRRNHLRALPFSA
jgi:hypothetical protein